MDKLITFFSESQFWPVLLTIGAFLFAQWLQKKTKLALLNPILVAVAVTLAIMFLTGTSNEDYQQGIRHLSFLLTPATICLGLGLYEQVQTLRHNLPAILVGCCAGAATSLCGVLIIASLFSLDSTLTVSLLPKCVTTAIGLALCAEADGIAAITTTAITLTGTLGALSGPFLCKIFRLTDPIARGVAFGTASHVIGTTKATEDGPLTGAVSSLSLASAGMITAVFFPIVLHLFL